ncbi:MAG: hypothetical protein JWQ73_1419 [Variovorax sp.]|nr:hypothetical protein [Variovorax sp.]
MIAMPGHEDARALRLFLRLGCGAQARVGATCRKHAAPPCASAPCRGGAIPRRVAHRGTQLKSEDRGTQVATPKYSSRAPGAVGLPKVCRPKSFPGRPGHNSLHSLRTPRRQCRTGLLPLCFIHSLKPQAGRGCACCTVKAKARSTCPQHPACCSRAVLPPASSAILCDGRAGCSERGRLRRTPWRHRAPPRFEAAALLLKNPGHEKGTVPAPASLAPQPAAPP